MATFWNIPPTIPSRFSYFDNLDKRFDTYSSYEKLLLMEDFNTATSASRIDSFIYEYELHNLVKEKTSFKFQVAKTLVV